MSLSSQILRGAFRVGAGAAIGAGAFGMASYIDEKAARGNPSAGVNMLRMGTTFGLRAGGALAGIGVAGSAIPGFNKWTMEGLKSMAPWRWPDRAARSVIRGQWEGSGFRRILSGGFSGRGRLSPMANFAKGWDVFGIGSGVAEYSHAVYGANSFANLGARLANVENHVAPFAAAGLAGGAYAAFSEPGRRARETLFFRPQDFRGGVTYGRSPLRAPDVVSGQQAVAMKMVTRRRL